MKKATIFDQMMQAYEDGDDQQMRELMGDYSPARMRIGYRVIEEIEGYTAACQARRGEHTHMAHVLGICE